MLMAPVLLLLAAYSWRRKSLPGALPFAIACLLTAQIALAAVMEQAAVESEAKTFWYIFDAIWHYPAFVAATCFILEYAWPGRWLTRRNLALLSIVPLLYAGLLLTNSFHHLIYASHILIDGPPSPGQGIFRDGLFYVSSFHVLIKSFRSATPVLPLSAAPQPGGDHGDRPDLVTGFFLFADQ